MLTEACYAPCMQARAEAANFRFTYGYECPVDYLAKQLADMFQARRHLPPAQSAKETLQLAPNLCTPFPAGVVPLRALPGHICNLIARHHSLLGAQSRVLRACQCFELC